MSLKLSDAPPPRPTPRVMITRRPLDWGWALGVPCAGLGVWAAWAAVRGMIAGAAGQETEWMAGLAALLGGLGALFLIPSYRNNCYTIQRNRLAAALPDEPWRWRPEWEAMRIAHSSRRWGRTVLELDALPGRIGGELRGTIVPSVRDLPAGGFHLTLKAVHVYVTGAGKSHRVDEDILWEGGCTAGISAAASGPRATFTIAIPGDVPETNDNHPSDEIVWRVSVSADVHGRVFKAGFVVPVFR